MYQNTRPTLFGVSTRRSPSMTNGSSCHLFTSNPLDIRLYPRGCGSLHQRPCDFHRKYLEGVTLWQVPSYLCNLQSPRLGRLCRPFGIVRFPFGLIEKWVRYLFIAVTRNFSRFQSFLVTYHTVFVKICEWVLQCSIRLPIEQFFRLVFT